MSDKPIIFSGPMVQAILDGRKNQTRRLMKIQPPSAEYQLCTLMSTTSSKDKRHEGKCHWQIVDNDLRVLKSDERYFLPLYSRGDLLYLKEAWRTYEHWDEYSPNELLGLVKNKEADIAYLVDGERNHITGRYRHARFMPRALSRIDLVCIGVRAERLNDISGEDARNEGAVRTTHVGPCRAMGWTFEGLNKEYMTARSAFIDFWNTLHDKDGERWEDNPWVWVIDF